MYDSSILAETIKKVTQKKNIQIKDMLSELKLNKNTLSNMYNGSMLRADSLARIADYLDCSIDFLLDRKIPSRMDDNAILSSEQQQLLDAFSSLSPENQDEVLKYLSYRTQLENDSDKKISSQKNLTSSLLKNDDTSFIA